MADSKKQFPAITKALGVQDTATTLIYQDGAPKTAPIVATGGGFATVAGLQADLALTYATVTTGDMVSAGGFRYEVAASGASDHQIATAGGVKLYVKPGINGYNVRAFGAVGDGVTDDSTAIQAALNAGKAVYVPDGTYLINGPYTSASGMEMQDGQQIVAESAAAVFLQGTIRFLLTAGTGDGGTTLPSGNKKNIRIKNLTLQNNAGTFVEQTHLLMLSAVSDVVVETCNFIGFQGDAVYLGSGTSGAAERHNENITIKDCFFDGVNNENRNAISIIDVDGLTVKGCKFVNCSKSTMPGPIDFEPNTGDTFAIGKNITVEDCRFFDCQGGSAFVYYTLPAGVLTTPPKNVKFINNYIDVSCSFTSATLLFITLEAITDASPLMGVEVKGNYFGNAQGMELRGVRGALVTGNTFNETAPVVIGSITSITQEYAYDVEFSQNYLESSGNSVGTVIVGMARRVNIDSNTFSKTKSSPYGITFFGSGVTTTSSYVTIQKNRFIKDTLQPQTHTVFVSSHTLLDSTTNRWFDNVEDVAMTNSFAFSYKETQFDAFDQGAAQSTVLAVLPDSYPVGQSWNYVNGDTSAPDANNQGMLETRKYNASTGFRKFMVQFYYPANNGATPLKDMYFRKGVAGSNTWSAWVTVTGV